MGTAVARHDEIVRAATEVAGGQIVKSKGEGDSTFSVFDNAGAALDAVVSIQRALAAESWLTSEPLRCYMTTLAAVIEGGPATAYLDDAVRIGYFLADEPEHVIRHHG
jgi:hypothetical protein